VTGGAGFIGSNLVKKLNARGLNNIIIIDTYDEKKFANILGLQFADFIDYKDGIAPIRKYLSQIKNLKCFFHIGANSNVLIKDAKLMMNENYEFSKAYYQFAVGRRVPFVYASSSAVYGNSGCFNVGKSSEAPHNIYAYSKWMFDKYVEHHAKYAASKVIGFRFFNVFGWNEFYKDQTACLPFRFYSFMRDKGCIDLFDSNIHRDYVWVDDLTEVLCLTSFDLDVPNGIHNLGGANPISHRRIAEIVVKAFIQMGLVSDKNVESYIKLVQIPEDLKKSFQYFTDSRDQLPFISSITVGNEAKIVDYVKQLIIRGV
jgi:ADP-L-glycero-D-manno-heptose 6-epimerase